MEGQKREPHAQINDGFVEDGRHTRGGRTNNLFRINHEYLSKYRVGGTYQSLGNGPACRGERFDNILEGLTRGGEFGDIVLDGRERSGDAGNGDGDEDDDKGGEFHVGVCL